MTLICTACYHPNLTNQHHQGFGADLQLNIENKPIMSELEMKLARMPSPSTMSDL